MPPARAHTPTAGSTAVCALSLGMLVLAPLLPTAAAAQGYTAANYPDLRSYPGCRDDVTSKSRKHDEPSLSHTRVCDPDKILPLSSMHALQTAIDSIETTLKNECGGERVGPQIAVALMRKMDIGFGDKESVASTLAHTLHDTWGVGHAACNDGVLLLLSRDDRQMHITTGAGVVGIITDGHVAAIIERMRPLLKKGKYDVALLQAIADMRETLTVGPNAETEVTRVMQSKSREKWLPVFIFGIVIVLGACAGWWQNRKLDAQRTEWQRCRDRLLELERLQAQRRAATASSSLSQDDASADNSQPPADAPLLPDGAAPGNPDQVTARRRGAGLPGAQSLGSVAEDRTMDVPLASEMSCCPICFDDFEETSTAHAAADEGVSGQLGASSRQGVTLPCRHRFHLHCIDQWMGGQSKNSCPICRRPAFGAAPAPQPPRAQSHIRVQSAAPRLTPQDDSRESDECGGRGSAAAAPAPPRGAYVGYYNDDAMDALFLLDRLHARYPRYVTRATITQWQTEVQTGRMPRYTVEPSFTTTYPKASSSGSGGKSRGFGGGSSRGGGGGGGGW